MELILDSETTRTILEHAKSGSPSPYLASNKLVSIQTGTILGAPEFFTFEHILGEPDLAKKNHAIVQALLDKTTLLIGHNLKFDLAWLRECGFKYTGKLWDTQIFEHVAAKGQSHRIMPSLRASAERRGIELPKLDVLNAYWKAGYNTHEIPLGKLPVDIMPPEVFLEFMRAKNSFENKTRTTQTFAVARGDNKDYIRDALQARAWAVKAGKGFERYATWHSEEPQDGLIKYALRDIEVTRDLYLAQKQLVAEEEQYQYMLPAIEMRNEFLSVLVDMERTGIFIDEVELERLEDEFRKELNDTTYAIKNIVQEYVGDMPYNISSAAQLSELVYGYRFKQDLISYKGEMLSPKKVWQAEFDLGKEVKGGVEKKKYPKRLSKLAIKELMDLCMEQIPYTEAHQCEKCYGRGHYHKFKKDGSLFKNATRCPECHGEGVVYTPVEGRRGGFCLEHPGYFFATVNGFSVDKKAIAVLLERAEVKRLASKKKVLTPKGIAAIDFLTALTRLGSIENYLSSFISGIRKNVIDGVLHTNFNQTVTATGRLSSSNPNFQNMPRARTFPVRKVVRSRWPEGKIISADVAQFEFRAAAFLSQCPKALQFIKEDRDIHMVSAEFFQCPRQEAKAHTFKPLFRGKSDYADHFYRYFPGIKAWQETIIKEAIATKEVRSPSGMIYAFPTAQRLSPDKVQGETQICNYPVQGLATGDLTPLIIFHMYNEIDRRELESRIILTVHDDITADCYPGEEEELTEVFIESFKALPVMAEKYFGIKLNLPIDFEVSVGYNWMDKEQVYP
jgi:DNA polymerase I-like protein with 3'-5' exonuclease and polymerase domains